MKIRNTITTLFTITLAVAALAVISFVGMAGRAVASVTAASQNNLKQIALFSPPIGFVPGETLRISVVNPNTLVQGTRVTAHVNVFNAAGQRLAVSEDVALLPGQIRNFDFNRDDLQVAGERDTGRLEVRAEIHYSYIERRGQISPNHFPVTVEMGDRNCDLCTPVVGFHFFVEIQ